MNVEDIKSLLADLAWGNLNNEEKQAIIDRIIWYIEY